MSDTDTISHEKEVFCISVREVRRKKIHENLRIQFHRTIEDIPISVLIILQK